MTSVEKGRQGEDAAVHYLESEGYRVIRRNYRMYGAEIDIVCSRETVLVFTEVKNWASFGYEEMERALNRAKRKKIFAASKGFLQENPVFETYSIRYDLIYMNGPGKQIKHVENAFTETGAI